MTDEQIIEGFMRAKMAADTPDDIDWLIYETAFWDAVSAHPEIFERLVRASWSTWLLDGTKRANHNAYPA